MAPTPPPAPFAGFARPEQNWFRLPNNWTDITAEITSLAELKLIEYVLKHTWGYREYDITKHITLDEFISRSNRKDGSRIDRGTGLSKPSVIAGIKSAIEHGYLRVEVDGTDKARVKKFYRLRMDHEDAQTPQEVESPPVVMPPVVMPPPEELPPETQTDASGLSSFTSAVKNLYPDVKNVYRSGQESLQRSETDTLERQQQKDNKTNNNRETLPEPDSDVVVVLSQFGIAKRVAVQLARAYPADLIRQKVAYLEFLQTARPSEVKKPAAWLRRAIEDDYSAPDGFVTPAEAQQAADDEKRRKLAFVEAQQQEYTRVAAEREARAAQRAAVLDQARTRYGTTPADLELWQRALEDLRYTLNDAIFSLLADAEVLQVSDDSLTLGLFQAFKLQQLTHPGYQKAIQRSLRRLVGRELALRTELLPLPEGGP